MTKSMLPLAMLIGVITAVLGVTTDVYAECAGNLASQEHLGGNVW